MYRGFHSLLKITPHGNFLPILSVSVFTQSSQSPISLSPQTHTTFASSQGHHFFFHLALTYPPRNIFISFLRISLPTLTILRVSVHIPSSSTPNLPIQAHLQIIPLTYISFISWCCNKPHVCLVTPLKVVFL